MRDRPEELEVCAERVSQSFSAVANHSQPAAAFRAVKRECTKDDMPAGSHRAA